MKFILGRHYDPADAENNLVREIAGSLVTHADRREKLSDGSIVVRDISEKVAARLRLAGFKIFIRQNADSVLSGSDKAFCDRLSKDRKSNDPDWNMIRKGDIKIYSPDELGAIYDKVTREEEKAG